MPGTSGRRRVLSEVLTGAIVGILAAVSADVLGVQDLIRFHDGALYLPAGIVGGLLGATRLRALLWLVAAPLAVLVLLVTYTPLVSRLAQPLIRRDVVPASVDAVAALSQGITPSGHMRAGTLDRLLSALLLARRLDTQALMVPVEHRRFGGTGTSDSADVREIVGSFDTGAQVIFVDSIFTTRTEALRMRSLAWPKGWRTIAVVTSPLHTRRACATFEAVGFRVVCVPAVSREFGDPRARTAQDRLRTFRFWLYETFATATYKSNGWIR